MEATVLHESVQALFTSTTSADASEDRGEAVARLYRSMQLAACLSAQAPEDAEEASYVAEVGPVCFFKGSFDYKRNAHQPIAASEPNDCVTQMIECDISDCIAPLSAQLKKEFRSIKRFRSNEPLSIEPVDAFETAKSMRKAAGQDESEMQQSDAGSEAISESDKIETAFDRAARSELKELDEIEAQAEADLERILRAQQAARAGGVSSDSESGEENVPDLGSELDSEDELHLSDSLDDEAAAELYG